jgi:hypothetical protein
MKEVQENGKPVLREKMKKGSCLPYYYYYYYY